MLTQEWLGLIAAKINPQCIWCFAVELCGLHVGVLQRQKAVRSLFVSHLKVQAAHVVCHYDTFFPPFIREEGNPDENQVFNNLGRGVLLPRNERNVSTHHVWRRAGRHRRLFSEEARDMKLFIPSSLSLSYAWYLGNVSESEEIPSVVRISATSRPQLSTQKLLTLQSIHQSLHRYTSINIWSKQVKQQHRWNCHSVSMSFIRVLKLLCCYFLPSYTLVLLSELLNWFGDWVTIQPLGVEGKRPLVCLCFCCWVQDLATQLLSDCFLKKAKKL